MFSRRLLSIAALAVFLSGCNRSASLTSTSEMPTSALQSCHDETLNTSIEGKPPAIRLSLVGVPYHGKYPISAVCTTSLVADLVRTVGGDYVRIKQLIRAEVDPHLFKMSAGDVAALRSADIIFYSGLGLEAKLGELLPRLATVKPTYAVSQYISEAKLLKSETGTRDPHVWHDVLLWREAVDVVRDALVLYDPGHAENYRARAADYSQQLEKLNQECERRLAEVPAARRVLVSAHDAFRYFGQAYQFDVRGIEGTSTEFDAVSRELNALASFISDRKLNTVFIETSVPDRGVNSLIDGWRASGKSVGVSGPLYSDGLGQPGTATGTYIGMIRYNVDKIVEALK
jgi:manganese/zinc/iron transport system substrate-binding protein